MLEIEVWFEIANKVLLDIIFSLPLGLTIGKYFDLSQIVNWWEQPNILTFLSKLSVNSTVCDQLGYDLTKNYLVLSLSCKYFLTTTKLFFTCLCFSSQHFSIIICYNFIIISNILLFILYFNHLSSYVWLCDDSAILVVNACNQW